MPNKKENKEACTVCFEVPRIKAEIYEQEYFHQKKFNNRAYVAILSLAASTFYVIGVAISWDQQITVLDFLSVPAF